MKRSKEHQTLSDALKADYHAYEERTGCNAPKALHAILGHPIPTLYQWAESRMRLTMQDAQGVIRALGEYNLVRAFCRNVGGSFVAFPDVHDVRDSEILPVVRETAATIESFLQAHADGVITEAEAEAFAAHCDRALEAIQAVKLSVRANAKRVQPMRKGGAM